jgi:uncharacterized membrane protein
MGADDVNWESRFRVREYVVGSLWVAPVVGGLIGGLAAYAAAPLDDLIDTSLWEYTPTTASTILAMIVGAMATLTGLLITITVLVVTIFSGYSARYMRLWYRDGVLKATLIVLVGTLTFAFVLLRDHGDDSVPNLGVTVAGFLVMLGLLLFLVFFDRFMRLLRPVAVAALVAEAGRQTFLSAMERSAAPDWPELVAKPYQPAGKLTFVVHSTTAGSIQAIDGKGLVRWASDHDCLLFLPHVVGDFVPTGARLIEVYGGTAEDDLWARQLRGMIAFGIERTIHQDPAFAVRIMSDIAVRALSPGINDPTTAVQILDYLGETLRLFGATALPGQQEKSGEGRRVGVVMRTRRWEDYLALGVMEIRQFGLSSIQVVRRLRAMLVELDEQVLPEHRAAVSDQLARLDASVSEHWAGSVDLAEVSVGDRQGIGGPTTI